MDFKFPDPSLGKINLLIVGILEKKINNKLNDMFLPVKSTG